MRFHGVHGAQQGDSEALIEVSSCHGVKARCSCLIASKGLCSFLRPFWRPFLRSCAPLRPVVGIAAPRGMTGRIAQGDPESSLATASWRRPRHLPGPARTLNGAMLMCWRGIDLNAGLCWRTCQAMATQQQKGRIVGPHVPIENGVVQRAAVLALLPGNGNSRAKTLAFNWALRIRGMPLI